MRALQRNSAGVWLGALVVLGGLVFWHRSEQLSLSDPDFMTGYVLFGLMVGLALYNARKKLSMVPLGRASTWLTFHIVGGLLSLGVFWLHTGNLWPIGLADQVLAGLFYFVCLSGIAGYGLQLWAPGRLARVGNEIIYERIPGEIASIRDQVEKSLLAAAEGSGQETLGRYYFETLAWYFARPRFVFSHAFGGRRAAYWLARRIETVGRYLAPEEKHHLARIAELGAAKAVVDTHYALQTLLKRWPLIHVPVAATMMALAVWHLILAHVFGR
jgi:hypothetical protein